MLPRKYRITARSAITDVKRKGKAVHGQHFTALILGRAMGTNLRFAFTISSKVSKKAVERNRLKRILSDILRKNQQKLDRGRADILIIAKQDALTQTKGSLEADFLSIFEKELKW